MRTKYRDFRLTNCVGATTRWQRLNAGTFKKGIADVADRNQASPKLIVLEASSIADIDFSAAQTLMGAHTIVTQWDLILPSRAWNP